MSISPSLTLLALVLPLCILTISGAGIFFWTTTLSVAIYAGGVFLSTRYDDGETTPTAIRTFQVPWVILPCMAAVVLVTFSVIHIPSMLAGWSDIQRSPQNEAVRQALAEARTLDIIQSPQTSIPLTRNEAGTLRTLVVLLGICMVGLLAASMPAGTPERFLRILALMAVIVAVAGFLHQWVLPKPKTIWWWIPVPHGNPVGSFVNRTHHSGLLAMLSPVLLGFAAAGLARKKHLLSGASFGGLAILSAAVLTGMSRGAVLAWFAGLAVSAVVCLVRLDPATRRRFAVGLSCIGVFLALALCCVPHGRIRSSVANRLQTLRHPTQTPSAASRFLTWHDALAIWRDYPLFGTGPDSFRMVFPQYRTATDRKHFHHAENEFIELASESGLAGVLLFATVLYLVVRCWRKRRRLGDLTITVECAAVGAGVAMVVHSMLDFPFRTPLYAFTGTSIIAMLLARGSGNPETIAVPHRMARGVLLLTCAGLLGVTVFWGNRPFNRDAPAVIAGADAETLARALRAAPTSWEAWYHLGRRAFLDQRPERFRFAIRCMERAVQYDPNNYELWERLGNAYLAIADEPAANGAFARMRALRSWKQRPATDWRKY